MDGLRSPACGGEDWVAARFQGWQLQASGLMCTYLVGDVRVVCKFAEDVNWASDDALPDGMVVPVHHDCEIGGENEAEVAAMGGRGSQWSG